MEGIIKFKSIHGFKGVLHDLHNDPVHGEVYQMTVYDDNGNEILHSDNAKPKTAEELKAEIEKTAAAPWSCLWTESLRCMRVWLGPDI